METQGKVINLVYDVWDEENDKPIANCSDTLGDWGFRYEDGFFDFYERFFAAQLNYERHSLPRKFNRIEQVWKRPNEIFYYFVKTSLHMEEMIKHKNLTFSPILQDCLKTCKNIFVCFLAEHESDDAKGYCVLKDKLYELGLPDSQFYFLNNNFLFTNYNRKYGGRINFHRLDLLAITSCSIFSHNKIPFVTDKPGKLFICHNRNQKPHRYGILALLKNGGILDNVNWSFVSGYKRNPDDVWAMGEILENDDLNRLVEDIRYFYAIDKKQSDYEIGKSDFIGHQNVSDISELPPLSGAAMESGGYMLPERGITYQNSYINIVTETQYKDDFDVVHITEKSFRPFNFYNIPIFVSTKYHVKYLKENYGFDVFDDIVDHSYDNEPDIKKRIIMVYNEIKRLNDNKESVIKFYSENQDRFEKNREIICNLPNNDNDIKFFKTLMS
jgi:hypothetical protein